MQNAHEFILISRNNSYLFSVFAIYLMIYRYILENKTSQARNFY